MKRSTFEVPEIVCDGCASSIQKALEDVATLNRLDKDGRRLVRIHAVGFPEGAGMTPFTSIRFSALMRLMCEQNNGTFVGITQ